MNTDTTTALDRATGSAIARANAEVIAATPDGGVYPGDEALAERLVAMQASIGDRGIEGSHRAILDAATAALHATSDRLAEAEFALAVAQDKRNTAARNARNARDWFDTFTAVPA